MYTYQFPKADTTSSVIAFEPHLIPFKVRVLAIRRGKDPFKGMLAFPGGFLEPLIKNKDRDDPDRNESSNYIVSVGETLEECASRELWEETRLAVKPEHMKLFSVQSEPGRDPRGHTNDHVYVCSANIVDAKAGDDAASIEIVDFTFDKVANASYRYRNGKLVGGAWIDEWAFDHGIVLYKWLQQHFKDGL